MRRTTRALALSLTAPFILALACKGGAEPTSTAAAAEPAKEAVFDKRPEAVPPDLPGDSEDARPHLNLQNLVHLADVDHEGLFIDFGTEARAKYTIGKWRTGWGRDGAEGETTFTNVAGNTGRIYFPLADTAALTLRLRLKPVGTSTLQPFFNNNSLPIVRLDKGPGFADYDIAVPAGMARVGENQLMLRLGGSKRVGDEDISVAVDFMHVLGETVAAPAPGAPAYAAPRYGELVKDAAVGGSARKAIVVNAPTTLSYYVEIPKSARLSLRAGALAAGKTEAAVRVTAEGAEPVELWKKTLGASWEQAVLPLERFAGQVARVELVASGQGSVAWSSPSILVPEAKPAKYEPAKHVVVLVIDTMRADHLRPFNAKTRVQTPAVERIAAEGTVFESTNSPENWTKPSVASILTGLYPASHGAKESESRLSDKALLISEVLKDAGFTTGTFLANGYVSDKFGFKQGWDRYVNYIRENKRSTAENVFKDAGDFIEANKGKRSFTYIQTIDPHVPYDPPPDLLKLYDAREYNGAIRPRDTPDLLEKAKLSKITFNDRDRERLEALYDAEVTYHDQQLGLFVERLKKLGVYDQTMFVISADHGEEFYDHRSYGHGHSVYQELLHVPFIVRWPSVVPAGKRISDAVGSLDVAPTVLAAAGLPIPEVMEGVDRIPHMLGATPPGPAASFSDFLDDRRAIRAGRWKLILRGINPTLFDLEKDPGEKVELDGKKHPIAMRYCRILIGQFLGTRDRGDWLAAAPKGRSVELKGEATEMDAETRAHLKALGYAN